MNRLARRDKTLPNLPINIAAKKSRQSHICKFRKQKRPLPQVRKWALFAFETEKFGRITVASLLLIGHVLGCLGRSVNLKILENTGVRGLAF